jgi:hypothetical protein
MPWAVRIAWLHGLISVRAITNQKASINPGGHVKAMRLFVVFHVNLLTLPAEPLLLLKQNNSLIVRRGYVPLWRRDSATDYEKLSVQRNTERWIKTLIQHGFIKPAQV